MSAHAKYQPSGEQRDLVAALEQSLAAILPLSRLHRQPWESEDVWRALDDLGLFVLAADEADGGLGLGAVEEALIAIALGRRLASPAVFARLYLSRAASKGGGFGPNVTVALKEEGRAVAVHDPVAKHVLVREGDRAALHALAAGGAPVDGVPWLDRLDALDLDARPLCEFGMSSLCHLRLIDAAALAGIAEATLEAAVEYAKMREQFGRPIGSFQAIKHHCANMAVSARSAADLVTFAAVALDEGRPDATFLVDSAFAFAAAAAVENAGCNIQIHGGIGFSDEADAHLFLKRAQLLIAMGGGVEPALERLSGASVPCPADAAQ